MSGVLDIEQADSGEFRSTARYPYRGELEDGSSYDRPIYGGQVMAQALLACGATVAPGRQVHSLHGYFLRSGKSHQPVVFRVDEDRDGGSYSSRRAVAVQNSEIVFTMSASFCTETAAEESTFVAPDVPDPTECEVLEVEPQIALEVRLCVKPSRSQWFPTQFWVRPRGPVASGAANHAAALAYMTDFSAGLPREKEGAVLGPSIDHTFWLHRPYEWRDWVLVELAPGVSVGRRGWYTGTVTARTGELIASFAQEMAYFGARS